MHKAAEAKRIGYQTVGPASSEQRSPGCCHRHQSSLRHQALPDGRRASALGHSRRAHCRHRERRRAGADRAHASHGRHVVSGSQRGATRRLRRRHRHSGEGHGRHSPEGPPAAQQSRALLELAHHYARSLPAHGSQRGRLCAWRSARAGRRADARRSHGLALSRARVAHLCDRDRDDGGGRRAGGGRGDVPRERSP